LIGAIDDLPSRVKHRKNADFILTIMTDKVTSTTTSSTKLITLRVIITFEIIATKANITTVIATTTILLTGNYSNKTAV
jgi:hypothetical protein